MTGPRGWQCPKCWKAGRKTEDGHPPKMMSTTGQIPASMLKVRYRQCERCAYNLVTEERPRRDQIYKLNKPPQAKRPNK